MKKRQQQKEHMIQKRLKETRDPRLAIIKEYILEVAEKFNVPPNEIHLDLNEASTNFLTAWQYVHKPSCEYINILEISWKHLETKKIK